MQRILKKYIISILIIAIVGIMAVDYVLVSMSLTRARARVSEEKLGQLVDVLQSNELDLNTLIHSLNEDYLTRARAFAYLIEKDASILEDLEELQRIAQLLNVDEVHVSDENGLIAYSSVPKYIGLDFHSGEQMRGFLPVLDGEVEYVVQEVQPNTAEGKMMQYVGVQRPDQRGIVQVGLEPKRLLEALSRNQYSYIFSRIPTDTNEYIFVLSLQTQEFLGTTSTDGEPVYNLEDQGLTIDDLEACRDGGFIDFGSHRFYAMTREYDDVLLGICIRADALYAPRARELISMFACAMLVGAAIALALNRMLYKTVVEGLQSIIDDLNVIRQGRLDKVVQPSAVPELNALSININEMVQGIKNTMMHLSWIIDITDVPMAAFEYRQNAPTVLRTSKLPEILRIAPGEMDVFGDYRLFQQKLIQIMSHPLENEPNVYYLYDDQYIRLVIVQDGDTTVGSVLDVSEEYCKQRHLNHERRHDALTGLKNYRAFQEDVHHLMASGDAHALFAGVMIDLDDFKSVNDTYGHDFGDEYLRAFAQILSELPADHCCYARRSGDEFCLFLYDYAQHAEILAVVEHLWKRVERASVDTADGQTLRFCMSGGLAWCGERDFFSLMHDADQLLYAAKQNRKGTCMIQPFIREASEP